MSVGSTSEVSTNNFIDQLDAIELESQSPKIPNGQPILLKRNDHLIPIINYYCTLCKQTYDFQEVDEHLSSCDKYLSLGEFSEVSSIQGKEINLTQDGPERHRKRKKRERHKPIKPPTTMDSDIILSLRRGDPLSPFPDLEIGFAMGVNNEVLERLAQSASVKLQRINLNHYKHLLFGFTYQERSLRAETLYQRRLSGNIDLTKKT